MGDEVMTAVPGDPYQEHHEAKVFIGEWRAFAHCSCGWKTKTTTRYYSPILDFDELRKLYKVLGEAKDKHNSKMNGLVWMLRRIWHDTLAKYKMGF